MSQKPHASDSSPEGGPVPASVPPPPAPCPWDKARESLRAMARRQASGGGAPAPWSAAVGPAELRSPLPTQWESDRWTVCVKCNPQNNSVPAGNVHREFYLPPKCVILLAHSGEWIQSDQGWILKVTYPSCSPGSSGYSGALGFRKQHPVKGGRSPPRGASASLWVLYPPRDRQLWDLWHVA